MHMVRLDQAPVCAIVCLLHDELLLAVLLPQKPLILLMYLVFDRIQGCCGCLQRFNHAINLQQRRQLPVRSMWMHDHAFPLCMQGATLPMVANS